MTYRFFDIAKVDAEQQIVEGFATTEALDDQGEIVDTRALKEALPEFMEYPALREMHQPSAVGVIEKAELIPGVVKISGREYVNPLKIVARIVDQKAWEKVKAGVYKGFSIGGKALESAFEKLNGKTVKRITKILLYEISLVDRPANPDAKILLWKGASMADSKKAVAELQDLRNQAELNGDLEAAALYTNAIALTMQAGGEAEEPTAPEPEAKTNAEGETPGEGSPGEEGKEKASQAGDVKKAGRVLSGKNSASIHQIIKGLAEMLASGGDAVAQDIVKCYDGGRQKSAEANETLSKTLLPALDGLKKVVDDLATRFEAFERTPTNNGPVLRPVEKTIVNHERDGLEKKASELRKSAATEPDPIKRQGYNQQLIAVERQLAQQ